MNFVERWFVRKKLEGIQKDLNKGESVKLSPSVQYALVAVGAAALEAVAMYLKGDAAPTISGAFHAASAAVVASILLWIKSPKQ